MIIQIAERKYIGTFDNEIDAAKAYDKAVDLYFPGGIKNFPNE